MIILSNLLWGRSENFSVLQWAQRVSPTNRWLSLQPLSMHRAQGAQESSANILQGCTREQQLKCTVNKVVNTPLGCFNTLFSLQLKTHALIQGSASIPRSMFNLYLPQLNATFFFTIRERPAKIKQKTHKYQSRGTRMTDTPQGHLYYRKTARWTKPFWWKPTFCWPHQWPHDITLHPQLSSQVLKLYLYSGSRMSCSSLMLH